MADAELKVITDSMGDPFSFHVMNGDTSLNGSEVNTIREALKGNQGEQTDVANFLKP